MIWFRALATYRTHLFPTPGGKLGEVSACQRVNIEECEDEPARTSTPLFVCVLCQRSNVPPRGARA